MNRLLRNAIILDTETTGLRRGSGLREISTFDLETKEAQEYLLDPNRIKVTPITPQDIAGFVGSSKDVHERINADAWEKIIVQELFEEFGVRTNEQAFLEQARVSNNFLYKSIVKGDFPQVNNVPGREQDRLERLAKHGINVTSRRTDVQTALKELPDYLRGKTVWIANVNFESKQIGSQLAADQISTEFKTALNLETFTSTSSDPFYVTGVEVNKARVLAQNTGDWRGVFEAYVKHVPKPGETAVRDIQDVIRATMSYGREAKLFSGGSSYFGTGIDITHKLMALASGDTGRAMWAEAHRATEDAAVHEAYVLEKSTEYSSALRAVQENTPIGQSLQTAAQRGQGVLHEATKYFSLLEQAAPHLQRSNLIKRFDRAYQDISKTGVTHQIIGPAGFVNMSQQTAAGDSVLIPRTDHSTRSFRTMQELTEHLINDGSYSHFGVDVGEESKAFMTAATSRANSMAYTETQSAASLAKINVKSLVPSARKTIGSRGHEVAEAVSKAVSKVKPRNLLIGAGIMTGAGAAWSLVQQKPKDQSSLLGYNYYDWLKGQEGMVTQGIAGENRSKNTDFGSPYRGPVVSNEVFANQDLLAEREKWLRHKYGAQHYDPVSGLFGISNVFKMSNGRSYIQAGEKVDSGYQGMRGKNLVSLNLDDGWRISVEDADTITVKRGGVRGAITDFFGLNQGYSFRLAGIDAAETAHKGRAAQPFADAARDALSDMMSRGGQREIVFDPTQLTYGRMMAGLVVDGKNLNYEMVKRGQVAHLPFGKQEDAIVDYSSMKKSEDRAAGSHRGMWDEPWWQAIHSMTENGQRPTFNTLADVSKIVANSQYMSMVAKARAAQEKGYGDPISGQDIGKIMGGADKISSQTSWQKNPTNFQQYMAELLTDTDVFVKTHGTGTLQNKFSQRSGYGQLDKAMALDSTGSTTSIWTKRRYNAFDTYGTSQAIRAGREQYMAERQRAQNHKMFVSPIGHSRM